MKHYPTKPCCGVPYGFRCLPSCYTQRRPFQPAIEPNAIGRQSSVNDATVGIVGKGQGIVGDAIGDGMASLDTPSKGV